MRSIEDLMNFGRRPHGQPAPRQFDGPQEGIIKSVSAAGIKFTIPDFDPHQLFGPAKYTKVAIEDVSTHTHTNPEGGNTGASGAHDHAGTTPPVGAKCLVIWAGSGVGRPWVIGWWVA